MTTITYRDGTLAADSCYTYEDDSGAAKWREFHNKIDVVQLSATVRVAIVTQGDDRLGKLAEHYLLQQFRPHPNYGPMVDPHDLSQNYWIFFDPPAELTEELDEDTRPAGIILYADLASGNAYAFWFDDVRLLTRIPQGEFHAMGCDAYGAFCALEAGASAVDAVHCAAKYGPYTAGPVRFVIQQTMVPNISRAPSWESKNAK